MAPPHPCLSLCLGILAPFHLRRTTARFVSSVGGVKFPARELHRRTFGSGIKDQVFGVESCSCLEVSFVVVNPSMLMRDNLPSEYRGGVPVSAAVECQ